MPEYNYTITTLENHPICQLSAPTFEHAYKAAVRIWNVLATDYEADDPDAYPVGEQHCDGIKIWRREHGCNDMMLRIDYTTHER